MSNGNLSKTTLMIVRARVVNTNATYQRNLLSGGDMRSNEHLAIARSDWPEAIPRKMSSRSANVSTRGERRRAAGAIPPWRANRKWMICLSLPSTRPIAFNDSPAFQRFHISARCAKDNFHRLCMTKHHLLGKDLYQVVLHRPVEPAPFSRS